MTFQQPPPFSMQVELTEGCNLRCAFCGINGIRDKDRSNLRFMTVELADAIAWRIAEAGWQPRIEFAMHGEPTMNPWYRLIVEQFHRHLPRSTLQLTTNGGGLMDPPGFASRADDLFIAGLNIMALDNYRVMKDRVANEARAYTGVPVYEYPSKGAPSPNQRTTKQFILIIKDLGIDRDKATGNRKIYNHAGAAYPKDFSAMGKRCALPFRELSVRWDGNVAICCNDWRGEFKVGNLTTTKLEDIWHHQAMEAARRKLLRGERDFGPCHGCNHLSWRPGLLPDHMGKETLPEPTEADAATIAAAVAGPSYTLPVLRPWEKEAPR